MRRSMGALLVGALCGAAALVTVGGGTLAPAGAAPPGAVYSGGSVNAQEGDPLVATRFYGALSGVTPTSSSLNDVTLSASAEGTPFTLRLRGANGGNLTTGTFLDQSGAEDPTSFQVNVTLGAGVCSASYANASIGAIEFSGGTLTKLAVNIGHRCNSTGSPVLSAQVVYNMPYGPLSPPDAGEIVPMAPVRALDTRATSQIGPGQSRAVKVAGVFVPANATAVVVNATGTRATGSTYVTLFPWGSAPPLASNLNLRETQTIPNLAVVKVGTDGSIGVYNAQGATDVILDIAGYVLPEGNPAGTRYHSAGPLRIFDSRLGGGPLGPGDIRVLDFDTPGAGVVPMGAKAVVLNVTAVGATTDTYVTVYPADQPTTPGVSNLNVQSAAPVPNLVVTALGINGDVIVYNAAGNVDIVADLMGYFDTDRSTGAGRFVPVAPKRLYDTRDFNRTLGGTSALDVPVTGLMNLYPFEQSGVVLNTTVANTSAISFLTVHPARQTRPFVSNLNWQAGETRPNLVMVGTGQAGAVGIWNQVGRADVILDVAGWFTG